MPITLAYVASTLENAKVNFKLIDSFGEKPEISRSDENFLYFGKDEKQILNDILKKQKEEERKDENCIIGIFANQLLNHKSIIKIIKEIKLQLPKSTLIILENTQAVTAYSLRKTKNEFLKLGVNYLLVGEPENNFLKLTKCLMDKKYKDIKNIKG